MISDVCTDSRPVPYQTLMWSFHSTVQTQIRTLFHVYSSVPFSHQTRIWFVKLRTWSKIFMGVVLNQSSKQSNTWHPSAHIRSSSSYDKLPCFWSSTTGSGSKLSTTHSLSLVSPSSAAILCNVGFYVPPCSQIDGVQQAAVDRHADERCPVGFGPARQRHCPYCMNYTNLLF